MKQKTNWRDSYIHDLSDFPELVEAVKDGAVPVGADVEVRKALREALLEWPYNLIWIEYGRSIRYKKHLYIWQIIKITPFTKQFIRDASQVEITPLV